MTTDKCFIIAEAGVNHNGSLELAKELVHAAADAGADAVKFQTFRTERLVTRAAAKADYQQKNTGGDNGQAAMLKALELSKHQHLELNDLCGQRQIEFMSTPFDLESLAFLVDEVRVKRIKLPSGEIANGPLLLAAARSGLPLIVSTGMCTIENVEESLSVLAWGRENRENSPPGRNALQQLRDRSDWLARLKDDVWLMHCVTEYPAPIEATHLRSIDFLRDRTGLQTGLSDHSLGWHVALAAVAREIRVLEKHFSLCRRLPGPDHRASLEPVELSRMIRQIRDVETALGNYDKRPQASELKNAQSVRGSLVAATAIRAGERFTLDNMTIKRSSGGINPYEYWDYVSTHAATRDYETDEVIQAAEDVPHFPHRLRADSGHGLAENKTHAVSDRREKHRTANDN